jgi:alkanesulfonate monooxygenase SsuD/methylene tetrahydromethanopterin reductase-like flavin-dependent oxidoreductase (luciferase family)
VRAWITACRIFRRNANHEMFEEGVEILFKAFESEPFSHQGMYFTIPPEVPYRGYTLKEITFGAGAGAARSGPSSSWRNTASAA